MPFKDRQDAGERLAKALESHKGRADAIVVALPRGGVVVGRVVADALGLPLDIVVPRKIGAEGNPEYAIGALTEEGHAVWNEGERKSADPAYLEKTMAEEQAEARRRLETYRRGRPARDLAGKTVIVVDDGIATGLTMAAAIETIRAARPAGIVAAVPVAPPDSAAALEGNVDELVVLERPALFGAIGSFYARFDQVGDDEVIAALAR